MKYNYMTKHNGVYYPSGTDVPEDVYCEIKDVSKPINVGTAEPVKSAPKSTSTKRK
jgi:hypothetical protein